MVLDNYEDILFFKNGNLSLTTNVFTPPNNKLYNTSYINCDYLPNILQCPHFNEFLGQIFLGENGDPDNDQIAKEWMKLGYLLYPKTKMEKIFIYIGGAANGKSVYFDFISTLFPAQFVSYTSIEDIISGGMERTSLLNARINIGQEFESDYLKTAEFKKVISGQTIEIKRKYQKAIPIVPKFKFIIALNEFPKFTDKSKAITRRLDIVEMNAQFVPLEEYQELKNPLLQKTFPQKDREIILKSFENEKEAIVNWAISGLLALKQLNWQLPITKLNEQILTEFQENNNPITVFLKERYEVCDDKIKHINWERVLQDCTESGIIIEGETRRAKQMKIAQEIKRAFNIKSYKNRIEHFYPLTIKQTYIDILQQKIVD